MYIQYMYIYICIHTCAHTHTHTFFPCHCKMKLLQKMVTLPYSDPSSFTFDVRDVSDACLPPRLSSLITRADVCDASHSLCPPPSLLCVCISISASYTKPRPRSPLPCSQMMILFVFVQRGASFPTLQGDSPHSNFVLHRAVGWSAII